MNGVSLCQSLIHFVLSFSSPYHAVYNLISKPYNSFYRNYDIAQLQYLRHKILCLNPLIGWISSIKASTEL